MKKFKYLFLLPAFCLLGTPVQAQDRNLTEAEITQLFDELFLKQESIEDTNDIEIEEKQREEIAKQILYHYTEDLIHKFKHIVMVEDGTHSYPFKVHENRLEYKDRLTWEDKIKNLSIEYKIDDTDIMGQKAAVNLTSLMKYQIDATDYDDQPKLSADATLKAECTYIIRVEYDDVPRIQLEDCNYRTLITNLEVEEKDHMEEARYTTMPPKKIAHYIIEGISGTTH